MSRRILTIICTLACVLITGPAVAEKNQAINVIITFTVKSDYIDSFKAIMKAVKLEQPRINGWTKVDIYHAIENPSVFTLVEEWDSKENHQAHINRIIASGEWESISRHLVSDATSDYFSAF